VDEDQIMNRTTRAFDSYEGLAGWSAEKVRPLLCVVIGCGALGSHLVEALASMGVGRIALIDDDLVQPHNLPRMAGVAIEDLGRRKVDVAAAALARRFGELTRVIPLAGGVQTMLGLGLAKRAGFIFLCADNRAARLHGCRAARSAGTPHISGAIDGFLGVISGVFAPPQSPCYECTLTARERSELMRARFSCVAGEDRAPSTPTTSIAAAITAAWMTDLVLRYSNGEREGVEGRRVFIDPHRDAVRTARYQHRSDCNCAAGKSEVRVESLDVPREEMTPRNLLTNFGAGAIAALDYSLVTSEICRRCGYRQNLFPPRHEAASSLCPDCENSSMTPTEQISLINAEHPLADCSFAQLGLPPLHWIAVRDVRGTRLFELSGDARMLGICEA
jgi:hypothetical protein